MPYSAIPTFRNPLLKILDPPLVNSPINVLPYYPALGHIWGFQTAECQMTHRRANLLCQILTYPHRDMTSYKKKYTCVLNECLSKLMPYSAATVLCQFSL